MGIGSCKNSKIEEKSVLTSKNINLIVFGLDAAGKTSVVKALAGAPTEIVVPTKKISWTSLKNPLKSQSGKIDIQIIDISGEQNAREDQWPLYYDQVHGWIFVLDLTDKRRFEKNAELLEKLIINPKLNRKPLVIFANKKDYRRTIDDEDELRETLDLNMSGIKHKIIFSSALPQGSKQSVDPSITEGFAWLIDAINENYNALNSRVLKKKSSNDLSDTDGYSSDRPNSNRLPNIHRKKTRSSSEDDDDERLNSNRTLSSMQKNSSLKRKTGYQQTAGFRTSFETFPEEMPWVISNSKRSTRSDDVLPRLNSKTTLNTRRKTNGISPLVHDTKSFSYKSSLRSNYDDEFKSNRYPTYGEKSGLRKDPDDDDDIGYSRFGSNSIKKKNYTSDDDDEKTSTNYTRKTQKSSRYSDDDDDDDDGKPYSSRTNRPYSASKSRYDDDQMPSTRFRTNGQTKPLYDDDDDIYTSRSSYSPAKTSTFSNYQRGNGDRDFSRNRFEDDS